jgi:hypothetical protein
MMVDDDFIFFLIHVETKFPEFAADGADPLDDCAGFEVFVLDDASLVDEFGMSLVDTPGLYVTCCL